jgi:hypothetical protein
MLNESMEYAANISITCLPLYWLEPNTRITVENNEADIHGDYMIKSFNLPLKAGEMMTIQATKIVERI